jgi:hypothetical protein
MGLRLLLGSLLILLLVCTHAYASKEGLLALSSFSITSEGQEEFGHVELLGKQDSKGIVSLHIKAMGREYDLSESQLASLRGFHANGIQLSFIIGMERSQRKNLLIQFSRGIASGLDQVKVLSISEKGKIEIYDMKVHDLTNESCRRGRVDDNWPPKRK